MVRVKGLEPSWGYPHTDLNRTRLPIPPHPHVSFGYDEDVYYRSDRWHASKIPQHAKKLCADVAAVAFGIYRAVS